MSYPQQIRPHRAVEAQTSERRTLAVDADHVIAAGEGNRLLLNVQVLGVASRVLVRRGLTTEGGTIGHQLDAATLDPDTGLLQGGGFWEDASYTGPVALRALDAPVDVQIEVL